MRRISLLFMSLAVAILIGTCNIISPSKPEVNSCQVDSDCVIAIDISTCCSCPEVMPISQVQTTRGLKVYIPGNNYGDLRPAICSSVDCSACPLPPAGAVCKAGTCQAPTTINEILSYCPDCYSQSAQAAYKTGNYSEAVDYCGKSNLDDQYVCYFQLFDSAIDKNQLDEAELLCRQFLDQDIGLCIRPLALKWAGQNVDYAAGLCNEMESDDARHFGCILDLAQEEKSRDFEKAQWICRNLQKSDEIDSCLQEIAK